jgi:prepilin-type N-terminal cleavage/methylation domain-containing protein
LAAAIALLADITDMTNSNFTHDNRGFTLIELMAAVGIASILMAIAVPNFLSTLPRLRLADAARQVATDLQQVRMKAIAQNIPYQISFSTTTYVLQKCNGSCANEGGTIPLPEGITLTSSTAPQFQPRGTAAAATTITLSNGTSSKWVCVKTVGRVNIQDAICS